jgi:hypothetical protein
MTFVDVQNNLRENVDVYEGCSFFARRERDFAGYVAPDVRFRVACDR